MSGVPDWTSAASIQAVRVENCSLSETDVDGWLQAIYTNWSSLTYATPGLDIGGSGDTINAAPSGTYQDGDPPTTGLEYMYEICEDPEETGNNTWSVTYNGGTAP